MGVKKQSMTIFRGSLHKHWIMYVTELHMKINPTDLNAVAMGNTLIETLATIKSQYIQPGFIYKHGLETNMMYTDPSVLHLKFVNGQEKQYHMGMSKLHMLTMDVERINYYIELERGMNGQDDELEDDA